MRKRRLGDCPIIWSISLGEKISLIDVDGIDPGRDFRKAIDDILSKCDVLLGVMGKNWLECKDEAGKRRLDDPADFVRLEIATALKRDIPVIPVRVQGACLPKLDQLPDDLKNFAYRNAFELTHEKWNSDVQLLTEKLHRYMGDSGTLPPGPAATPPPANQQQRVSPLAASAVVVKKTSTKKIVKWCLVGFFSLGVIGSLGSDEAGTALFGVVLVAFLAWDPFKWFVDKT